MLGNSVSFIVSSSTRQIQSSMTPLSVGRTVPPSSATPSGASSPYRTNTNDAVGNILTIVANMKASAGLLAMNGAGTSGAARVGADEAISAYMANAAPTVDDARAALGEYMNQLMEQAPASHRSLANAYRSGAVTIEHVGVETSKNVTLQLDDTGKQIGSAFEYFGSEKAIDFLKGKMGGPDGSLGVWGVDKNTNQKASWMAIGNDYFYITWN